MVLGFEHLPGKHTGRNMATIVMSTIEAHGIDKSRILTITTDNATSNEVLVRTMQEAVKILHSELGQLSRVPCLAHVIQLTLKDLVDNLKITPKNNKTITEWHEEAGERQKHSDANRGDTLPWTFKKVDYYLLILQ